MSEKDSPPAPEPTDPIAQAKKVIELVEQTPPGPFRESGVPGPQTTEAITDDNLVILLNELVSPDGSYPPTE